jgi:hypothetical protein
VRKALFIALTVPKTLCLVVFKSMWSALAGPKTLCGTMVVRARTFAVPWWYDHGPVQYRDGAKDPLHYLWEGPDTENPLHMPRAAARCRCAQAPRFRGPRVLGYRV